MPETADVVQFVQQSPGFYRSTDGRFDLVYTTGGTAHGAAAYWLVIDWELGKAFRHHDASVCELWAQKQAETQPGE